MLVRCEETASGDVGILISFSLASSFSLCTASKPSASLFLPTLLPSVLYRFVLITAAEWLPQRQWRRCGNFKIDIIAIRSCTMISQGCDTTSLYSICSRLRSASPSLLLVLLTRMIPAWQQCGRP